MQEKIISGKKNGALGLIVTVALFFAGVALIVLSAIGLEENGVSAFGIAGLIFGIIVISTFWIAAMGLKILKPQEALVLTLFGKYYGTLKGEGFYWVNPFCVGVNPAADTKLNQSGHHKFKQRGAGWRFQQQENFAQGYDAQQQPPEDQRCSR